MRALQILAAMGLAACRLAFAVDCQPQTQVDVSKIQARAILVGETHGTQQAPAFVGGLVCSLLKAGRPVILALERIDSEQPALDRYLDSDGSAADRQALLSQGMWTWPMQDGRSSTAVLALIESVRELRRAGQPVGILAFEHVVQLKLPQLQPRDPTPRRMSALMGRMIDRMMADQIAEALSSQEGYTAVVLAGSYHTATKAGNWAEAGHQPMGEVLASLMPIHVIGLNASAAGTSWYCTNASDCGRHRAPPQRLYSEGAQIDEIVDVGALTASEPALPSPSR